MPKPQVAPYGSWKSPITSDLIVSESIGLGQIALDGQGVYWSEGRPQEGGRNVIVRRTPDGRTDDVIPPPFNARTRVHEYGGGAFLVDGGTVYFANFADQRLYRQTPGGEPQPLIPQAALRYADLILDRRRNRIICVREDHTDPQREAVNAIAGVDLESGQSRVLISGNDFYAAPRLSPDGAHLAWLTWNHPNMPWDGCELWVGEVAADGAIERQQRIAGGVDESIFQPEWSPDGELYFVSDRAPAGRGRWWNPYRWQNGQIERLVEMEAEFGMPQWLFGFSTYAFESAERLICAYTQDGVWHLASLDTRTRQIEAIDTPYTSISGIRAMPGRVVFHGGSPTEPMAIVQLDLATGQIEVLRRSGKVEVDPGYLSAPQPVEFPTEGSLTAHGFFYPPRNRDYTAPPGERPPLLVISHGGPTGSTDSTFRLGIQYWTSRGFAVLDVNYGGSTGYGRAYRQRLNGQWGVVDVDDCVNGARYLVKSGQADGERLIIRGGSAGGYTTLCALTFCDVFKAGASYYGIGDLEAMAKETHKFESRYLDRLVGPYPEQRDLYLARSPIHHTEGLACPVIFFQGLEDQVVPPNQAEAMTEALCRKGVPVAYLPFEGEQHGFRRAENIKRALDAELYFYARVFGFELAGPVESVEIEAKARELLAQLALDEKIEMMDGDVAFWPGMVEMMGGGYADHPWPAGVISRLGIPGIRFADGPRGVVMEGATTFPVSMARGAAWDVALEERIGDVIGRELRALGGTLFGGVCINLLRHPAWGRAQETYGEDPYHLGEMGAALTRGVQRHAMACVKHFALNSMENARFKVNVRISPRALHEIYLPHFKRVVDEGVAAVMSAYNSVNGEWCGQNKVLLTDILKKKWGFGGYVLSDFMFGMRDAKKAALAGQDLEMPFQMHYHQHLKRLVENGQVPLDRVDEAVLRLLRQQLRLLRPNGYDVAQVGGESHRALAREAAEKSIVLLQNKGDLLPLRNLKKIAVIGRLADMPNTGDAGSSNTRPAYVVTPLAGIQAALKGQAEVLHDDGSDLERATVTAQGADAVVLVVGYTHIDEGEFLDPNTMQALASLFPAPTPEQVSTAQGFMQGLAGQPADDFLTGGDRDRLTLHPDEEALIQAIAAANPQTIVAVMGGSSVLMEAWRERVPSILMLWYPGMEGGHALADILLGWVNPSGKLPFVIPQRAKDLPFFDKDATEIEYDLWHGYRKLERDGHTPAFPFGFGLSYTRYRYANVKLAQNQLGPSETLSLSLDVSNIGAHAGEEVVQLYVSPIGSAVERAPKELKAFTRIALQPGETKTIQLDVPISRLAYYDETRADFVVEPLEYELFVGAHSLDRHALKARFMVRGE